MAMNPYGWSQADPYQRQGMNAWGIQQGGGPNPNAQDLASKMHMQWQQRGQMDPMQQQRPTFSANQGPYQMPGGPGQISTVGGMVPNAGPRPQQPPQPALAPGQRPYNGPQIAPMQRPPQSAFGQQNPTRFIGPYGQQFNRGTVQNPYQPQGQNWGW